MAITTPGTRVRVRDKRDGQIAIAEAEVVSTEFNDFTGLMITTIHVVKDDILAGMKIGVPTSTLEKLS